MKLEDMRVGMKVEHHIAAANKWSNESSRRLSYGTINSIPQDPGVFVCIELHGTLDRVFRPDQDIEPIGTAARKEAGT